MLNRERFSRDLLLRDEETTEVVQDSRQESEGVKAAAAKNKAEVTQDTSLREEQTAKTKSKGKSKKKKKTTSKEAGSCGEEDGKVSELRCNVCRKEFSSRNKLFQHIKNTGHAVMMSSSCQRSDRARKWACLDNSIIIVYNIIMYIIYLLDMNRN